MVLLVWTYATSNDYSPFNLVGGTNSVTGDIAAGQGFFARGLLQGYGYV
jgi:hypothetical protein